jgi:glycosyltransferase involved in cell wall biosynthesis
MPEFVTNVFFWLLAAGLLGQIILYFGLFRRLAFYKWKQDNTSLKWAPVSIIIAARNEEINLQENLPLILEQEYPEFEVIVINDQSEDETKYVLEDFERKYPRLKVVTISDNVNDFAGKKLALTLGIKAAKYDRILLTDADCKPASSTWLSYMASGYSVPGTEVVLGFSPYRRESSLLNGFIQFDTFYTALQYFSMALAGSPYMGVGRNLSYDKGLFFRNKGYAPYLKIASGDDDLFINQVATKTNTSVQLHPDSFMLSQPKMTWGSWLRQKIRHMRTGRYYKTGHKRALAFVWLANILFYITLILGFIFVRPIWIPLAALGLRLIIQVWIMFRSLKVLRMQYLLPMTPIIDAIYQVIYLPIMSLAGFITRKKKGW